MRWLCVWTRLRKAGATDTCVWAFIHTTPTATHPSTHTRNTHRQKEDLGHGKLPAGAGGRGSKGRSVECGEALVKQGPPPSSLDSTCTYTRTRLRRRAPPTAMCFPTIKTHAETTIRALRRETQSHGCQCCCHYRNSSLPSLLPLPHDRPRTHIRTSHGRGHQGFGGGEEGGEGRDGGDPIDQARPEVPDTHPRGPR